MAGPAARSSNRKVHAHPGLRQLSVHLGFSGKPVLQFTTGLKIAPRRAEISRLCNHAVPIFLQLPRGRTEPQRIEIAQRWDFILQKGVF